MSAPQGAELLQVIGDRVVARYLEKGGSSDVTIVANRPSGRLSAGVDITHRSQGAVRKVKVKPDAYFGSDPSKVGDRSLAFYRPDAGHYALEAIANHLTREPGWMFTSDADDLYYYYVLLSQSEDEIAALAGEPEEVFFGELAVERDQLRILPMAAARVWFEQNYEDYTARPVTVGNASAWYRLVPRGDLDSAVPGTRVVDGVFEAIAP